MDADRKYLDMAARAGMRAAGNVEPNPMVGSVVVQDARVLGIGHHMRFGEAHAERAALRACAAAGADPRGATMYVTLEPCAHTGKQPPCTEAIIAAGIAEVVCAREDPNPVAAGGSARLREAGVRVRFTGVSAAAIRLSDAFVKRVETGLPRVVAKWAQSIDGKVATANGESKWLSGPASRRMVHRLRARMDAIITGIGTVLADDPLLTAREAVRVRREALRVVVDSNLRLPLESALVRSVRAGGPRVRVCCGGEAMEDDAVIERAHRLQEAGVEVSPLPSVIRGGSARVSLRAVLAQLGGFDQASNVLVEAGPGLLSALFNEDLADEALVFTGPRLIGDAGAPAAVMGWGAAPLAGARTLELVRVRRLGEDVVGEYRRSRH